MTSSDSPIEFKTYKTTDLWQAVALGVAGFPMPAVFPPKGEIEDRPKSELQFTYQPEQHPDITAVLTQYMAGDSDTPMGAIRRARDVYLKILGAIHAHRRAREESNAETE